LPATAVRLTAGAVCHLLLCCLVSAQEGAKPGQPEGSGKPPSKPPQSASPRVEESRPVLYYLKDQQGKLVPVPGMTWEDFKKARDVLLGIKARNQRPPYALQSMLITGTAGAKHAELTVQVKVLVREEGWVRVPLCFDTAELPVERFDLVDEYVPLDRQCRLIELQCLQRRHALLRPQSRSPGGNNP